MDSVARDAPAVAMAATTKAARASAAAAYEAAAAKAETERARPEPEVRPTTGEWYPPSYFAGIQQVPTAPTSSGSTRRDLRVFMYVYSAYARRLHKLTRGSGRPLFLMPLSACIDPTVLPRICELEIGRSFDEVSKADWHRYFLDAATPRLQNLKGLDRVISSLILNTKIVDGSPG
jgi:hypothetical protein